MTNINITETRYLASTITSSRVDLSSVFMPLQFGGQYPETGYKLSNGADLNTLFCKKYLSTMANKTSLLLSDDQDLSDVFEKRHTVGYSTKVTTTNGIRVVYPFNSSTIYCGGDRGTFFNWDGIATAPTLITANTDNQSIREIYARNTSNVYIGGTFTAVGTYSNTAYLAKYTGSGSVFTQVNSTALNGYVNAMSALDPSNVYFGGDFTNGGTVGTRISRLNTYSNTFTTLTSDVSLNAPVYAISALDASNVYIGGSFTNAGSIGNYITRWDGEKYNRLGNDDFNELVATIHALDPSHVYIVGVFTQYGSNTNMDGIAMWDGTNMIALGNGLPNEDVRTVYALDESHVYIGFGAGGTYIKMWNGRDYITLAGSGSFGLTSCLSLNMVQGDKSTLYFGGGGGGAQKWTT